MKIFEVHLINGHGIKLRLEVMATDAQSAFYLLTPKQRKQVLGITEVK